MVFDFSSSERKATIHKRRAQQQQANLFFLIHAGKRQCDLLVCFRIPQHNPLLCTSFAFVNNEACAVAEHQSRPYSQVPWGLGAATLGLHAAFGFLPLPTCVVNALDPTPFGGRQAVSSPLLAFSWCERVLQPRPSFRALVTLAAHPLPPGHTSHL